jgi:SAM-dependent methyltransferase
MTEGNALSRQKHWEEVYRKKAEESRSWFQAHPKISLELLENQRIVKNETIIDIGGGDSRLVDHLLERGFTGVSVLDIAESSLEAARTRLGPRLSDQVRWIEGDVTQWRPDARYRIWHDRAVFHFLTSPADQMAYLRKLDEALVPQAIVIIATFSLEGPERCSGLQVQRYSPESLARRLGPRFRIRDFREEDHRTPSGISQRFQYSVFEYDPRSSSTGEQS